MARKKTSPDPTPAEVANRMVVNTTCDRIEHDVRNLRNELIKCRDRIDEVTDERDTLATRVSHLEGEIEELENAEQSHSDSEALCEQLESLATDVDRPCAPQTPEQWRRCLRVIAAGGEWEVDGTWR